MTTPTAPATRGTERFLASELAGEANFLIARARSRGSAEANARLAPLGLRVRSYSVLSLACSGLHPTQRELAEFLSLDPSQIVALVDNLEKDGHVRRIPDPNDRRSKLIDSTEAGQALYERARALTCESEALSLAGLSAAEQRQFLALLNKAAFPPN
ncbi:MarR family winged helix-turn-helix transcriptional regulator [Arthrobacter sp. JSM 101049]|uniref:MarR family winged helix-turn-helix transcriptional regulator n=1 Tax=Arthrobacter sp. JSM 101049 TaxID=929097 RepID=UPI003567A37B